MKFSDWLLVWTFIFAWYHVGVIWLVQIIAWPIFGYVGPDRFEAYHQAWWRGIRYVIFLPSGFTLVGNILLLHFTPAGVPEWVLETGLGAYLVMYLLTAVWYGPQQAKMRTTDSPRFQLLNRTNWIRTALISLYGLTLALAVVMRMKTN